MDSRGIPLLERWGCLRREQISSLARQAWLSAERPRRYGENPVNSMWIFSGRSKKNVKKQFDSVTQKSGQAFGDFFADEVVVGFHGFLSAYLAVAWQIAPLSPLRGHGCGRSE